MGCGGSKATSVAIDPTGSQQNTGEANKDGAGSSPAGTPSTERAPTPAGAPSSMLQVRRPSRVAPLGASTENLQAEDLPEGEKTDQRVVDQALAFVIPFGDEPSEESIIRKHPPKRLQRLEEGTAPLPTLEEIAEKQAVAEMRRQKILQNRVQSSKLRNGKSTDSENPEEDDPTVNEDDAKEENGKEDEKPTEESQEESKEDAADEAAKVEADANKDEEITTETNKTEPKEEQPVTESETAEKIETADKEGVDY